MTGGERVFGSTFQVPLLSDELENRDLRWDMDDLDESRPIRLDDSRAITFESTTLGTRSRLSSFPRIAILSSAPPTPCGLATFTMALGSALQNQGVDVGVVRVLDATEVRPVSTLPVEAQWVANETSTLTPAIDALNRRDVVLLQHEYGLYGGPDGDSVLELLDGLCVPVIAILHTVLSRPTTNQRRVLNRVLGTVDGVVVMTRSAECRLRDVFELNDAAVRVIAHGAAVGLSPVPHLPEARPIILTWGLIGPGKGIEWAIDAMATLKDLSPSPVYVIAGRTHPKVLAHQGDVYRRSLERRVAAYGLEEMVVFDNTYRDLVSLNALIASASLVVLPYDSHDQATSGVLVDAIAAGRPVVATNFSHAAELLSSGAGVTVEHGDGRGLGQAIRRVLTEPDTAESMAVEAQRLAPSLDWNNVACQYRDFASELLLRTGAA